MSTYHDALTAPDSVHEIYFRGTTDPTGDPANHVTTGKTWLDTSGSTKKLKRYNGSGWDVELSLDHADLTGTGTGDPHPQYLLESMAAAKGDLLVATADDTWTVVGVGTDGTALVADSTQPAGVDWKPTLTNPMTAEDDLVVGGASGAPGVLAKGTDGQVLTVDATTHHLVWADPATSGGTVTSVDLTVPAEFSVSGNPVTGAGTLAVAKATQSANRVWAGPTSGGAAAPTFRALVSADLPAIALDDLSDAAVSAPATGQTLRYDGANFVNAHDYVYVSHPLGGDGTNAITTGVKAPMRVGVPKGALVEAYLETSGASGNITVDILRAAHGSTTYTSIVGGSGTKPTIADASSAQTYTDTAFTSWTATTFAEGDGLRFQVTSAATLTDAVIVLKIRRTP